jgi:hypothetical protein
VVKTFGDQLLTGPPFANNEHGPIERCRAARPLDRVEERQALADELVRSLHFDRLLVVNPTIWQGFSPLFSLEIERFR